MSTNYCECNDGHWYQQIWSEYHLFHLSILWFEKINFSKPLNMIAYKIGLIMELNFRTYITLLWASLVAQMVKNFACSAGDPDSIPGWGSSPGEGNGHPLQYSCWRIPSTEAPGRLQYMVWQRIRHDWATNTFTFIFIYYKSMQSIPCLLLIPSGSFGFWIGVISNILSCTTNPSFEISN